MAILELNNVTIRFGGLVANNVVGITARAGGGSTYLSVVPDAVPAGQTPTTSNLNLAPGVIKEMLGVSTQPTYEADPASGAARRLTDGERVRVVSRRGQVEAPIRIDPSVLRNGYVSGGSASMPSRTMAAKAASISWLVLALKNATCRPTARAASSKSFSMASTSPSHHQPTPTNTHPAATTAPPNPPPVMRAPPCLPMAD